MEHNHTIKLSTANNIGNADYNIISLTPDENVMIRKDIHDVGMSPITFEERIINALCERIFELEKELMGIRVDDIYNAACDRYRDSVVMEGVKERDQGEASRSCLPYCIHIKK